MNMRTLFAFIAIVAALQFFSPASACADTPNANELLTWQVEQLASPALAEQRHTDADTEHFFETLLGNEIWMRELLDSGPIFDGSRTLTFLKRLHADDPDLVNRPVDRSMATACALELRNDRPDDEWMYARYVYFRNHAREGLLNSCYKNLMTWERRFLARGAQYVSYTSPQALEYLRERICWPRAEYVSACWQAPYRGHNCFDDSVQGWLYYHPFRGSFRCDPEMAISVGGVCGALSNMGASAAIANGIPALTMGEPGHCAYAVQTAPGEWTPAYSLSWKRGLHASLQRQTWPSHILVQRAMERTREHARAQDYRRLARWHESHGDTSHADNAYQKAVDRNGLDEGLWREYLEFLSRDNATPRRWERAMQKIYTQLLPDHPEPAWSLLKQHVYPHLLEDATADKRANWFARFLRRADGWGPSPWDIGQAFEWMHTKVDDASHQHQFMLNALHTLIDSTELGPPYVAWAIEKLKNDESGSASFERALLREVSKPGGGPDAALRSLARKALPAAADAHDLSTFQRIGKVAARLYEPRPTLQECGIEPFPGTLLSSGGALRIWEPGNRWDSPEQHWGVLEERGGSFHTQVGDAPWFEIELPHFGEIHGIILEGRRGQLHRGQDARILVSDDGENWTQIATLEGAHLWYRLDLKDTKPRGRFVRVERDGKCMHFPRVLIYGRRAS